MSKSFRCIFIEFPFRCRFFKMVLVPRDAFFEEIHRKSPSLPPTFLRSVCRCLFGPVDHHQTKTDLRALNERLLNEAGERWNFDFRVGEPVHGKRYDWFPSNSEEVEVDSRLDFVPYSYPRQISNNCNTATVDLKSRGSNTRPYSPLCHNSQISASSDVTSRLAASTDGTASCDMNSDVIDSEDVSHDVDRTETGRRVTCRRKLSRDELTMPRSATISGSVRSTKNRTKTKRNLVRTLVAQRSAITGTCN